MSSFLAALLALAAAPENPLPSSGMVPSSPAAPARVPCQDPRCLREAVRAALRRWGQPKDDEAETAARELLGLYRELERDSLLPKAQREQYRVQLRHRLLKLSEQISYLEAVKERKNDADRPVSIAVPRERADLLAQRLGGVAAGGLAGAAVAAGPRPRKVYGGPSDAGEQLVELIQKTVAPASWDVHGGPGSIYYWRPGRALSVRHTAEVHEQVGGLLQQLRQAGP